LLSYRPNQLFNPITWTGTIAPAQEKAQKKAQKKAHKKAHKKKHQRKHSRHR
jgi:hypothetical protein